ncbi:hypothetical protein CJU90_5766 [Yarrowia sp. C11]|nr:hypothetical protein CJU90_5766 [Yarrowia sp. C11]KAG5364346.1 hypothetical protein CKK34_3144 [Yarrowia sp. E02]
MSERDGFLEQGGRESHDADHLDYDTRDSSLPGRRPSHTFKSETKPDKRYFYAGISLVVSLVAFVVQTETAGYVAHNLQYKKPIFMLYLTHSSWVCLLPLQLLFIKVFKRWKTPWRVFLRRQYELVLNTARATQEHAGDFSGQHPLKYIMVTAFWLFVALSFAGSSWYIAVNLTTPSDLTAIYNCSAFFAYAFSVPMLGESLKPTKVISVVVAIVGVLIVSYWDTNEGEGDVSYPYRGIGNLIIGVGAILYGLYEVMYKKLACPPNTISPRRQAAFANVVAFCIGCCTVSFLWMLLPILHWTGLETFELPHGSAAGVMVANIASNAIFSGSFLILMALTSPVIGSVAALLTIFLVAITDWLLFDTPIGTGGVIGGLIIIGAFVMLSYASFQELGEEAEDSDSDEDVI